MSGRFGRSSRSRGGFATLRCSIWRSTASFVAAMSSRSRSRMSPRADKQEAIRKLQSLQRHSEGSNVHSDADKVLCDFLDAVGYGEIASEFRKVHELYPTVTPRYSRPSWPS